LNQYTPILIIPGVLGSEMFKDQTRLWASVLRMANPLNSDDFMDSLAFAADLKPSDPSVFYGSIIDNPDKLFDYSEGLMSDLNTQGYKQNQYLFTFPYDWRYGVTGTFGNGSTTVDLLQAKIQEIRNITHSDKIDVIAHSTGGLLVKKYVMDNPADHHIDKAIFVGVPNTGAPKAIKTLVQGDNFNIYGLNDQEMKKISRNLPIIYDLFPSQKYFATKGSYYKVVKQNAFGMVSGVEQLDFDQTNDLLIQKGFNSQALINARELHTAAFDDYDLRTAGVDLYSIVGCKADSIASVVEKRITSLFGQEFSLYDAPETKPGDGTVPLESATNLPVDQSKKYYALKSDHGKMLSQNGIRQEIINLATGSGLSVDPEIITQDFAKCDTKEQAMYVYSPVDIEVTDEQGNTLGFAPDGSLQNDIPNAGFYVFGERKFVFLPTDNSQHYNVNLKGTDNGSFTFKTQEIANASGSRSLGQMAVFSDIPVTASTAGTFSFDGGGAVMKLDTAGDGSIDQISPSAILNSYQSQDLVSPTTTLSVAGTEGNLGYFRSDVTINLQAIDPLIPGFESQTSGVLKTKFKLDDQDYGIYDAAVVVQTEGLHTLTYYSIDRAGNEEQPKLFSFTIDKTPPEVTVQFNLSLKDLEFKGVDNLSLAANTAISDNDNMITLTDQAGNATKLILKDKNRKKSMKTELVDIKYNDVSAKLAKNRFDFAWEFDKKGQLKFLSQHAVSKKDFNIRANFANEKTLLAGKDQSGRIFKTVTGLAMLKITTNQGDLGWSVE